MLNIENIHKTYQDNIALTNLNINIEKGQLYALLGQNGAGKTTTINCCLGFTKPDEGRVLVNNYDPALNYKLARESLAYIPENVNLYGELSGLENLSYFSELTGAKHSESELIRYLERSGLQREAINRRLKGYSKGMRQKVGIAIALAKQAKILLLDEPTSGLDPRASYDFSELLKELIDDGMAILMATHDLFRARDVATHIGVMREGELRAELNPAEISLEELEHIYLDVN